ncbi:amidohydrolase [Corynebacterium caspium]|uniref:amidohydrolase n=1 Tax=Corynebacterium caspium TaxID=234828 RepID=UPI00036D7FD3|nr:amidohydrolase [Corynebacterium caspium]WKD59679.1 putative hydrolase YxeP [Corynebacterium caspium DSM 44850]
MLEKRIAQILQNANGDLSFQKRIYQQLHAHPELSGLETVTAGRIQKELQNFDCEVITGIGGHGIVAIFRNGPGKTALMRADFDGLPIREETGASFASQHVQIDKKGIEQPTMHACGHDMHVTATLGLCALMDANRQDWQGTFIALFQPSEENLQGAKNMLADGLLSKIPAPDICFGQHILPGRAGEVYSRPGPTMATTVSLKITIPGISNHASVPHQAIDPTFALGAILMRLQAVVGREVNPHDFAVVTVAVIKAGIVPGIIPGSAELELSCCFYDSQVRDKVIAAIKRLVRAECLASNCPAEPIFEYNSAAPLTHNEAEVFATVRPVFDAVFGENSRDAYKNAGGEDFSHIPTAFKVPYLYWFIGCTPHEIWDAAVATDTTDQLPSNHMPNFLPDFEHTVNAATKAAAAAVLTYLVK